MIAGGMVAIIVIRALVAHNHIAPGFDTAAHGDGGFAARRARFGFCGFARH